ncbi:MAG TPA: hypothetical protein EYQ73_05275 [Candidatus Poseidoniales archaeon]|nr:hypothetical protein [Candidatus Poseidoniales archaeon]
MAALIPMDAKDLLAVSPKLLAQAILHRRERIADLIPNDLESRRTEQAEAEPLAKAAREKRDKINTQVANLKKERNESQKAARALFEQANEIREVLMAEGGIKDPDPKWAKEKLSQKLSQIETQLETSAGTHKTEEKFINEMKALIREHQEWVSQRSESQPMVEKMRAAQSKARDLLDTAQKAHDAMGELVDANAESHQSFIQWEEVRRRSTGRAHKLEDALASSQSALEFWQGRVEKNDFVDLSTNAERVRKGGLSSKAIVKEKREQSEKTKGGEEE